MARFWAQKLLIKKSAVKAAKLTLIQTNKTLVAVRDQLVTVQFRQENTSSLLLKLILIKKLETIHQTKRTPKVKVKTL